MSGSEAGSALVEFALFVSLMVVIFVGLVDYALMLQQELQMTEAASAAAAFGSIPGNAKNLTGMQAAAASAAPGVSNLAVNATDVFTCTPGGAVVTSSTTCTGYGTPIEYVQVQTSATVPALLVYVGIASSLTLRGSASFRVQWIP
jgi:Flp pilus assembly protein TadG